VSCCGWRTIDPSYLAYQYGTTERLRVRVEAHQRYSERSAGSSGPSAGGQAEAVEADLRDPAAPPRLFDAAEAAFGPVEILINNATGKARQDTFGPTSADQHGRHLQPVTFDSATESLEVDGRGSALMITEFARRHLARGAIWGRIVGLTSGGRLGFPEEVSYGAGKAALVNYAMSAAFELARFGITSNVAHPPVTDTDWITPRRPAPARAG
jgi:3-oxoacyl-[acyl-carrier protein] reductase